MADLGPQSLTNDQRDDDADIDSRKGLTKQQAELIGLNTQREIGCCVVGQNVLKRMHVKAQGEVARWFQKKAGGCAFELIPAAL
ncbi:hypothetical protein GCM10028811_38660 [Uliginosibacterium sediminicola]